MATSIQYTRGSAFGSGRLGKFAREENIFRIVKNREGVKLLLAMVADESGAFPGGNHASSMAADMVGEFFKSDMFLNLKRGESDKLVSEGLQELFNRINTVIYSQGIKEGQHVKLSMSLALMVEDTLHCCHIGTGRILLMQGNNQDQISQDNSWLSRAIKEGRFTVDRAMQIPPQDKIPFLGMEGSVQCQFVKKHVNTGESVAVFSDGIGEFIPNSEVAIIFNSANSQDEACERLVDLAKERGLSDNATILSFTVEAAREQKEEQEFDEEAPQEKNKEKRGFGCNLLYFLTVLILLGAMTVGSYIGLKNADKLFKTLFSSPAKPKATGKKIDPDLIETGKNYLVKKEETAALNFFRLNGRKLDPAVSRFEINDANNRLEILPIMSKGTYWVELKINSKNYYEIYEGASRNKVNVFEDNVKLYLTKGAAATLRPDEIHGVTSVRVSGLGSPLRISFSKQNMILLVKTSLPQTLPTDNKKGVKGGKETGTDKDNKDKTDDIQKKVKEKDEEKDDDQGDQLK